MGKLVAPQILTTEFSAHRYASGSWSGNNQDAVRACLVLMLAELGSDWRITLYGRSREDNKAPLLVDTVTGFWTAVDGRFHNLKEAEESEYEL